MRWFHYAGLAAVALVGTVGLSQGVGAQAGRDLTWAFPVPGKDLPPPPDPKEEKRIPGSTKMYTRAQIGDLTNPPDWIPDEHPPAPVAVAGAPGRKAFGCGACHLMSGSGHPLSAKLDGMPAEYIARQMAYFRSGIRKDSSGFMNRIAQTVTPEEDKQAAEYFSVLKRQKWTNVIEADMVPETTMDRVGERELKKGGKMEPIGARIITVPQDPEREEARDPHSGFIAYVPKGSVKKGEALVKTAPAKTVRCSICHGADLKGLGEVPGITGLHPIYIARQLYNIKRGDSNGKVVALMKQVVVNLNDDDILNIAAYLGSLEP